MKRVAIFAHYDSKNVIKDYVIYYLKELKKVVDKIIFVSDSDVQNKEEEKIKDYIDFSIIGKHGEYDFGSYKRGYQYAKGKGLLEDCEELVFANDSCYAPMYPFEDMFSKMSPKALDFWGATANPSGIEIKDGKPFNNNVEHVQSYFVVFKSNVFKSELFDNFINSIKKENTKEEVIAYYEVGMSKLLSDNGFKYDVYCELSKGIAASHVYAYDRLIKENKSPFLKRNVILFKVVYIVCQIFTRRLIKKYTQYNYELIRKDRKQNISIYTHISSYILALRKFILRIHFKERKIYFLGKWYSFGK